MRKWIKTITVITKDGSRIPVDHYKVTVEDPTLTGTVWKARPQLLDFYYEKNGEEVTVYEDGSVMLASGEMAKLL